MAGGEPDYPPGVTGGEDYFQAPEEEGPMTHELKIWPEYFDKVKSREKTFEVRKEVRKDERDYNEGDILVLKEWDRRENIYTGQEVKAEVTYLMNGGQWGLERGYVIMALRLLPAGS